MRFALEASTAFMKNPHWMRAERNVHTMMWIYQNKKGMVRLVEFKVADDELMFAVMHNGDTEFFITLPAALEKIDSLTSRW